jgi:hypothetical protein
MPINVLASEQSNTTEDTSDKVIKLLNYCKTHPETKIQYHASDMIVHIHSDASYLSESEAKSRDGGFFYIENTKKRTKTSQTEQFWSSAKYSNTSCHPEIGAVFINAKEGAVLRTTLEELGHKQPPIPMETDNTTSTGYSNATIKQELTKAMDMRFYWIKDRVKQGQLKITRGQVFKILRIISQNTIRRRIINEYETYTPTPTNAQ